MLKAFNGWTHDHQAHLTSKCGLERIQCYDICQAPLKSQGRGQELLHSLNLLLSVSSACYLFCISEADKTHNKITCLLLLTLLPPLDRDQCRQGEERGLI